MILVLYRYKYRDSTTGKRTTTRYHLTEDEAMQRLGLDAERLDWSRFEVPRIGSIGDLPSLIKNEPIASTSHKKPAEAG